MKKCSICGGMGVIEKNGKSYECECAFIRRIAAAMPPYIRKADVKKEHLQLPILSQMDKHLLVIGTWSDMKAVIKALMISNHKKLIRITSDREIRDVYVGSKSRAARGDEDGKIYNSLEDLMDIADLTIVKLNELSYKNKAAPGALEEAVSYRTDRDKPVWLFSDSSRPFIQGSFAYSDSIDDIIKTFFKPFRIPSISTLNILDDSSLTPEPIQNIPTQQTALESEPVEETPKKVKKPAPKIRPSQDDDIDSSLSIYGSGISTSSKFKRKS